MREFANRPVFQNRGRRAVLWFEGERQGFIVPGFKVSKFQSFKVKPTPRSGAPLKLLLLEWGCPRRPHDGRAPAVNGQVRTKSKVNYPTSARRGQKWGTLGFLALAIILLLSAGASAQAVKRLILTDGSYQAVTEWKVEGDRVKYFSAERGEWEEMPKVLVDWKTTEEWNASAAKSQAEELKQVTEEEMAARKAAELNTPLVAPKLAPELRLPEEGGVFVLEMRAGKPVLQQLQGVNPQENKHETANRLKRSLIPVPLMAQVQTIELQGGSAKLRLRSASPEIFVDVEDTEGPIAGDNFRVVRLERKRGLRVVATTKTGLGGESVKQTFVTSRAEGFGGNWWKLVLLEELTPGEYAIVVADRGGYRSEVLWDFGVDK
jgi:hypothetical protein